jgi:dihydrofolate synthase/folylpolyglutamate synthase
MLLHNLSSWLQHIRTVHTSLIDYSLERIRTVALRLDLLTPKASVIMITGTNGKGSTVSAMEAILIAADYRVGAFTSPYLCTFNEQIRINAHHVCDDDLIAAFKKIDTARAEITLSEFEFTTLAALLIFKNAPLDIILLEVGLGGAHDAVNIIQAHVTVITSLALDHEEFLGATVEAIALQEAQLLPPARTGIIGVSQPPANLIAHAQDIRCNLLCIGRDFYFQETAQHWRFWNNRLSYENLPLPKILCKNAALAIATLLSAQVKFSEAHLKTALLNIDLPGRLQFISGQPAWLLDVAHNLEAIENLTHHLHQLRPKFSKVIAVFSMFKDKKIADIIKLIAPFIDQWAIAPIDHPRGASLSDLILAFTQAGISEKDLLVHDSLDAAYESILKLVQPEDLLLGFGSFFVVRAGLHQQDKIKKALQNNSSAF